MTRNLQLVNEYAFKPVPLFVCMCVGPIFVMGFFLPWDLCARANCMAE
jgi:hypothetical protein